MEVRTEVLLPPEVSRQSSALGAHQQARDLRDCQQLTVMSSVLVMVTVAPYFQGQVSHLVHEACKTEVTPELGQATH